MPNNNNLPNQLMSWPNIHFFSMIAPYSLIFFFVLLSIFNTNIKGLIYLIGLIIMLFFSNIVDMYIDKNDDGTNDVICNAFALSPFLSKSLPFGILVYTYTFTYLFIPMIETGMINYPILMFLIIILGTDFVIQNSGSCYRLPAIMFSIILGLVSGIGWSLFITYVSPSSTYHTDYLSDKQVCSMPSKQKFKCKVYKNGELISSTTT